MGKLSICQKFLLSSSCGLLVSVCEMGLLKCSMCFLSTNSHKHLLYHYVRSHRHDPRFFVKCQVPGCGSTYTKWWSYKKHVYRQHRNQPNSALESYEYDEAGGDPIQEEEVNLTSGAGGKSPDLNIFGTVNCT